MNTGKNYNKIVYGSRMQKLTARLTAVKEWLDHPELKKSHLYANRPQIIQYIDFLTSVGIYGATLQDYLVFEFYKKSHREKSSYVTGRKQHKLFDRVNEKNKTSLFKDKNKFSDVFSEYTGREIFNLDLDGKNKEEAKKWLETMDIVFAKPSDGVQGRGVTRLVVDDNPEKTIEYCLDNNLDIIEEALEQHSEMKTLHPKSINTIRFITLIENNDVKYLGASLRMGIDTYVDNGGIYVSVNMTTGKIDSIAYTNSGEKFDKHPITNHPLKGFQIPFWNEVIELCKKAAFEVPDVRCVGWDVAITKDGPVIIEGNDRWSRFVWQLPKQKGLYDTIKYSK